MKKGVIHGRFQMFHLKHLEYVLAAKMHCKKLYIGITHPDNTFTASSPNDKHGVTRRDNPMTFLERFEMIQERWKILECREKNTRLFRSR